MTDVLVLGDANPDLILRGDVVPRFGQSEQLLSSADLVVGGSGAITAHGLARLGRPTRLCATIGADALGDLMRHLLVIGGVDAAAITRTASATGVTVVLSDRDDRAALTFTGAVSELTTDLARAAIETAARDGARHLHVSSFFLLPALSTGLPDLLSAARSAGMTTSLDTNFDPAERWDGVEPLLSHLDLMLPNRAEVLGLAARITGSADPDPVVAATALARRGPVVVVKDGAAGAVQVDPDGTVRREPGARVVPVDTTGAGDTFDAAYLDARLSGLDPARCLRRGTAAGALATSAVGGTAAQPTLDQLHDNERDPHATRH